MKNMLVCLSPSSYPTLESRTRFFFSGGEFSFLKVWGCDTYVKRLQPDKLKPKLEKCTFIGYPKETIGYTFYHKFEGKIFVAKNGNFLEKVFLSKEVSGRKVELDEVIVPSLELESSSSQETVPVMPTQISEEANDDDHETLDQVTIGPRRSNRECSALEWYGNPFVSASSATPSWFWSIDDKRG